MKTPEILHKKLIKAAGFLHQSYGIPIEMFIEEIEKKSIHDLCIWMSCFEKKHPKLFI